MYVNYDYSRIKKKFTCWLLKYEMEKKKTYKQTYHVHKQNIK